MSKGLQEQIEITERKIKQLEDKMTPDTHFSLIDKLELEYCKNNFKYLKALEIIKERHIDILSLEECIEREKMGNVASALEYYNENYAFYRSCELTQEEFDLLKEVLDNDK